MNKKISKDKRGMLLASETLKMVLAVISIMFLIALLASIYFSVTGAEKEAQAASTLERIGEVFSRAMSESNFTSEVISEINPAGWKIFIFTGPEAKPDQCARGNCLCLCDRVDVKVLDRQMKECIKDGVCLNNPNLIESPDIEIQKVKDGSTSIRIIKGSGKLEVRRA